MNLDISAMQKASASARALTLMKALSNEHRLLILCQLWDGEKSVGELGLTIGLAQSPLSQHLALLRRHKLVSTRRDGQTIYYALAGSEVRRVIEVLHSLYCGEDFEAGD